MDEFIGLYPISKTLRFELKPIGKTLTHIERDGILNADEHRAESYKKVKKIIDEYHKHFISESLQNIVLDSDALQCCMENMGKKDSGQDLFKKAQDKLRRQIAKSFETKRLLGKELITEDLPVFLTEEEQILLVNEFQRFTTYFTGFNENRRNMYTDEAKSTGIAFRLVNDNLPKHIGNTTVFRKIKDLLPEKIQEVQMHFIEGLNGFTLEQIFEDIDCYSLFLTQDRISLYNCIIGGWSEGNVKIQGLNEHINLYNQQHKDQRLPKFVPLFKMILSDRESLSWLPEQFESDNELLERIEQVYQELKNNVFNQAQSLMKSLKEYNLNGIYIKNDTSLTSILKSYYGDWSILTKSMEEHYDQKYPCDSPKKYDKHIENRKKFITSFQSFSLADINYYLKDSNAIEDYFCDFKKKEEHFKENKEWNWIEIIEENYKVAHSLLNEEYKGHLIQDDKAIEKIKMLLDSIKDLQWFLKPLAGKGTEGERDGRFYADYDELMGKLDIITPLYNMTRNYLTRKGYSEEKFKLNFDNSHLLDGWDVNKEQDNSGVILRGNGLYYLAIMNKEHKKVFDKETYPSTGECYEKMDYKQIALPMGLGAFVRKCFSKAQQQGWQCPDFCLNDEGKIIIKDDESKSNLPAIIDCYKDFLNKYEKNGFKYSEYDFRFSTSSNYNKLSVFFREVEQQGYKISFRNISKAYIDQLVEEGKIYLFQIYNKDFSLHSKGTPNMHTMYWRALFSEDNLKDVIYKLNGQAEIFFRKKSVEWSAEQMIKGFHYNELKDKFDYPIIKDRRYTMDKFQFHVPITINFKSTGSKLLNDKVRDFIKRGGIEHIIGIDRGERHLLYLSMIDLQGNIVKQFTLNEIVNEYNGQKYSTDYHKLLNDKEQDRDAARKNWKKIENIKELKEGYLSQVVHIISKMMVEYKAIVVLENLNGGFVNNRKKVEKQVYQKFENALISKLNYLVDKKKDFTESGGLMQAYQLTTEISEYTKFSGNQCGFIFYIPAWNTSKIDPVTGFCNYINTKYESVEKSRELFSKFEDIRFNKEKNYYEFVIKDYSSFNKKADSTRNNWTLCTFGTRIETFRNPNKNNEWDNREINLTDCFDALFSEAKISRADDIKSAILAQYSAPFFKELHHLLALSLQLRNSITGSEEDYILSPVADENGIFYDSRNYQNDDAVLPKDADANGAYNIARKGLWAVRQIQQAEDFKKCNLAITNTEWLQFIQQKPYLK